MPVVLILLPPRSISPAEHHQLVASTPASFSDIPPILRHKEENVSVSLDPLLEGFEAEDGAKGTLYVTESVLAFISETGKGFQITYPTITLHAIARGEDGPTIYCQLDETSGTGEEGEEDTRDMRELKVKPVDTASLEPIFEALSLCAALHPDPQGSDDDMDDAFMDATEPSTEFESFSGDGEQELSEIGRVRSNFVNANRYAPY
ncbi:regulator of volume decrease after cellular swelling-domain-containing protein [Hysterangium stoloniferum]|nr:regulator of volume decrease after cellular swelling-domain-containing protein [Hysterangium stoloniferum]